MAAVEMNMYLFVVNIYSALLATLILILTALPAKSGGQAIEEHDVTAEFSCMDSDTGAAEERNCIKMNPVSIHNI